jgi:hypothetical protein
MAHHLFCQLQATLKLGNSLRLKLKLHQHINPFLLFLDGVGQTSPAPVIHGGDFAAAGGDELGDALLYSGHALFVSLGVYDECQLIASHILVKLSFLPRCDNYQFNGQEQKDEGQLAAYLPSLVAARPPQQRYRAIRIYHKKELYPTSGKSAKCTGQIT